jgi:adenylate cyclase
MADVRTERRLAAILSADVVGYSRLVERDEAGTLAAVNRRYRQLVEPLVGRHRGRVAKLMGDGVLVEFASAVNAVACAVELQRGMAEADAGDGRGILLRVGISLGDIVVSGGDVFGDGVIIAARLQALAEPGSIWLAGTVYEQVERKLEVGFDDLGPRELKNLSRPVHVYRVAGAGRGAPQAAAAAEARPAIAVLPFANPGGGAEEQYLGDGIAEDIITELSRYRSLFVIARSSAFQFRGPPVDLAAVRRKLGVRYVVEGSVRRAGGRLRVGAQLIDAAAERQLWAERYDRELADVFLLQDEVARTIATTLEGRVAASGAEALARKPTADWQAYDCVLQGRALDARFDHVAAEAVFARAAELDPGYAHAHAWRALALVVLYGQQPRAELLVAAEHAAQRALILADHDARTHQAIGYVALFRRRFDLAAIHYDRASALNPNDVLIAAHRANLLSRTGRPEQALRALDEAMRRDPYPASWLWEIRFRALYHLQHYPEAIAALGNIGVPNAWHHGYLAASLAQAGQIEEAQAEFALFRAGVAGASPALVAAAEPYSEAALLDQLIEGLHLAGLRG